MVQNAQELVGAVLNGKWRLVRLLGEGGMGAVYEAEGSRGEGKRAIKLLHQEYTREPIVLQRFLTEAHGTRSLVHPNVSQVLDASTAEDGTPYIVMELLNGMPLGAVMGIGRPMPAVQAAPIVYGMLMALGAAHAMRIIHRDIKPDNVFLARDGRGRFAPKLVDFGIAKVMDAAGGMGTKTRTGVLLGTPGYMSPEQIRNSKAVDLRSDLWSVAVIFYEMLTGQQPFPADNEFARLTAVLTEEMKPVELHNRELAPWSQFFARALAKDAAQRFQSAEEMARALSAVAQTAAPISDWSGVTLPGYGGASQAPMSTADPGGARPQKTVASTPPPNSMANPASSAPRPGAGAPVQPTHMSALKPVGTPTISGSSPSVAVVPAPPLRTPGVPWWAVGVVGFLCVVLGFAAGLLVARR